MANRDTLKKAGLVGLGVTLGVLLSLNFSAVANRDATTTLPIEDLRAFSEVFGRIKSDYVENVTDKKLIREAINGMVNGLDPHSTYLDEDAFRDLQVSTKGEFGGLGIEVGVEDGFVRVIAPIEDTPAYRAGIKAGDLIYKINETYTKGLALTKAVGMMRGEAGSKVTLSVVRKGVDQPLNFTLQREQIKPKSVVHKMVEPGYAFLRVRQFQERTGEEVVKSLQAIAREADLKGLVLDLRGDPGGLLNAAVGVSAAFLPKDALIVYTDGRTPESKMRLTASREYYARGREDYVKAVPANLQDLPMVVLVDGGSASAAEIVAGALQDHKRAYVMGTPTFGKGSVQTIVPLGNSTGIKLTTARYYTPKGRSIQAKGIEPDQIIDDGRESANRVREADLTHHLEGAGKDPEEVKKARELLEEKRKAEAAKEEKAAPRPPRFEFGSNDDFQLTQALNHLKGQPVVAQAKQLSAAK
jgi:carboxyl-terminal processing protease